MSERKVLNKYFPPDFDPSKIPKRKMGRDRQQVVRLMAPFSMRCTTCGEYVYKGKKFNARKETAQGEEYYGIRIFRFYIKCPRCSGEITFKTDPKNTDYVAEHGAMRNFEPWRDDGATAETEEERLERLAAEAEEDPMAELEKKTVDQKREMDIIDKLQEVRQRNARLERADVDLAISSVSSRVAVPGLDGNDDEAAEAERRAEEEDERQIRKVFGRLPPSIELDEPLDSTDVSPNGRRKPDHEVPQSTQGPDVGPSIKRKLDDYEPDALSVLSAGAKAMAGAIGFGNAGATPATAMAAPQLPPRKKKIGGTLLPGIRTKPKA